MSVALQDYAGLQVTERVALAAALAPLTTLERVLTWSRELTPPATLDEILTQDEYTHDVVLRTAPDRYLVFDTT